MYSVRGCVCFLLAVIAAAAGLFYNALPAGATLIIPSSERYMAQRADAIIIGRVTSVAGRWNADHSLIYTDIGINVSRIPKAGPFPASGRIVISVRGGTVDGLTFAVDEQVEFQRGEEVLLFLVADPDTRAYTTYAQYYGKYVVTREAVTGRVVIDGPSFHRYQHYNPATMERERSVARPAQTELTDFVNEIIGYLGN